MMADSSKFDRRKEEIVTAAVGLLNHKGVRGMTLPLVAAKLHLAPRAVSYYFRRKEDLAAACFRRSVERMNSLVLEAAREEGAAARVRAFVRLFFEAQQRVVLGEAEEIAWFEDMRTVQNAEVGEAFTAMFRALRELFSAPGAPALDRLQQNARTHLLLSQMFWAVLWLPRYNPEDYLRLGERCADILLAGMVAPGAAWAPLKLEIRPAQGSAAGPAFLTAATDLINEQGYLGASVNKISARLNVSKGSFYHHNQAKDDLVEQCFERTWTILRDAQSAADRAAPTGFSNLAAQAVLLVGGQVSGETPLLRTSALAAVPEEMRPSLIAGFDRTTARYASVVCDGMADGSIRPLDAPVAAQMTAGAINAGAELRYWAPGLTHATAEAFYVRPLFMGILCPPS